MTLEFSTTEELLRLIQAAFEEGYQAGEERALEQEFGPHPPRAFGGEGMAEAWAESRIKTQVEEGNF